jgi:nitrogen fixation protein NifX
MSSSIRVAFATNDNEHIDAHFGSTPSFSVYDVSKNNFEFFENIKIEEKDTDKTVALLKGIDIVYFTNIGPAAAAKVINSGIFPIKYTDIVSIQSELEKLIKMLGDNPPPFIKKIMEAKAA